MSELSRIILLFFIYAIIGWLWETVYCSLKAQKFVYRGFLVGPYCPIYGFGVLSVLYFVEPYQNNLMVLYIFSAVLVTVLEYLTSYVLERLFHTTWWDYHEVPLNINGRVAVPISLFWGLGCVLIVKVVHPKVMILEELLEVKGSWVLPLLLVIGLTIDLIYTVTNMLAFQKAMVAWSQKIEATKVEIQQTKERVTEEWQERLKEKRPDLVKLPKLNFNHRRMLNSFSRLQMKEVTSMKDLRMALKDFKERQK